MLTFVFSENDKVGYLEEQYEILHSSVIALTSHFSQVSYKFMSTGTSHIILLIPYCTRPII